jgi:hypothetical protein
MFAATLLRSLLFLFLPLTGRKAGKPIDRSGILNHWFGGHSFWLYEFDLTPDVNSGYQ